MKPGEMMSPLPSMSRGLPLTSKVPTPVIRSPLMARSPLTPGLPEPSIKVAPRMTTSASTGATAKMADSNQAAQHMGSRPLVVGKSLSRYTAFRPKSRGTRWRWWTESRTGAVSFIFATQRLLFLCDVGGEPLTRPARPVRVERNKVGPLRGHLPLREDRLDRALRGTSAAVDALVGVNVQHL